MKTVYEYIKSQPAEIQQRLQEIRACILAAAPTLTEETKWSRPAYSTETIMVMFAGFKQHTGFYATITTINAFRPRLKDFKIGGNSVQFPHNKPLPPDLIKEMVQYRLNEFEKQGVLWR
jgi:uncharacterized protein YdhG (YjbR/CyaY superfamily)